MKGLFGKTYKHKGEQQTKKKSSKIEPITNSIRNPSNQLELFEALPDKVPTSGGTSPCHDISNDSDYLLNNPTSIGFSDKQPRPQQTADTTRTPTTTKLSWTDPQIVTHALPLSSSLTTIPPIIRSESCTEYNPVLLSEASPWDQITSPSCLLEPTQLISHSWEQCKSSSPSLTQTISNSYDSQFTSHEGLFVFPIIDLNFDTDKRISSELSSDPVSTDNTQSGDVTNNLTNYLPTSNEFKKSISVKDPSIISESEFQYFTSLFFSSTLNPQGGLLYGEQARNFFQISQLPNEELSRIWQLSDIDNDLKLTFSEFCIAMKLVRNRKKGIPLPQTIPNSIFESLAQLTESQQLNPNDPPLSDQYTPSYSYSGGEQLDNVTHEDSSLENYVSSDVPSFNDEVLPYVEIPAPLDPILSPPDGEDLEETVTVENSQFYPNEEIEDPIPKESSSSSTTDYTYQIKSLFTPTPNPLPPPPTKTEMQQRAVLTPIVPIQAVVVSSPRVEITPVVQMRSHTTEGLSSYRRDEGAGFLETEEQRIMLSLPSRGGTDPKDLKNKGKARRRPDRVSAVILIDKSDHEDPQVSLINNGEIKTIDLSPNTFEDQNCPIFGEINHSQNTGNEVQSKKVNIQDESTPHSSPGSNKEKIVYQKKDSKMNILKKKFMPRNKKNTGSNASLDKISTPQESKKKSKVRILNKRSKKHNRSSSLDIKKSNPRLYGSQNDIHLPKEKTIDPVIAMIEESRLCPQNKAVSALSLSPTHEQRDTHNDSDSFDSSGSYENLDSDSDNPPRMRNKKIQNYRKNRSLSSPECVLSTPPIPDPFSEHTYSTTTDLDDNKTPQHEPTPSPVSYERELLNQRIHETFARCESLRNVNSQLISELNQIRLQKKELAMQLRYHQPPRNIL
ncbi:RalBP1-associated Eps domain-containing protein 2 isoform X2 [Oopsacas minuta]|uniref:RalBP1-associated Eps domain-containing protein 2 isoform X2 n=1 Tax=Oopsacas minuta TaxID=111878 RepID=A0AAV7K935_9METZ|nr:RalBP1-associated Eps domain-containing protein 2 isoform X2 [Oopsacas minuta]